MNFKATYIQQLTPGCRLVFVPDLVVDGVPTAIKGAKQYDTKEEATQEAERVISRFLAKNERILKTEEKVLESNPDALNRLNNKLNAIRETIDDMSEEEYGRWVDSLEFDEFLELVKMGE